MGIKNSNFMKNVLRTTVICDQIEGITVISNLVLPPLCAAPSKRVEDEPISDSYSAAKKLENDHTHQLCIL